ncbi:MAG: hypothetical protein JWM95_4335, partial [Gemmatimonadetes bacterium]|nr:hypothetical protein [Gemmatimonadota bacterium]
MTDERLAETRMPLPEKCTRSKIRALVRF